jgi:L-amino acid N-acyltransferase YncA
MVKRTREKFQTQISFPVSFSNMPEPSLRARVATLDDAPAIVRIYNQGMEDRIATFETRPRTEADIRSWFDGVHPVVAVESEGQVIAFASTSRYRDRDCYAGIAEVSLYVARDFRRRGAGRLAMQAIIDAAEKAGFWKLLSRVFLDNHASRGLIASLDFREVGIYEKHGKLDGIWRDVLIVERLIPSNLR